MTSLIMNIILSNIIHNFRIIQDDLDIKTYTFIGIKDAEIPLIFIIY